MLAPILKAGNRVEISLRSDKVNKVYTTKIEKIINDTKIMVFTPISYGVLVELPLYKNYNVLFNASSGLYASVGFVSSYLSQEGMDMMIMEIQPSLKKVQRREFFRFKCLIPFKFSTLLIKEATSENDEHIHVDTLKDGIIKDICGGGIRFVTNEELSKSKLIQCIISLNGAYIMLLAKILHTEEKEEGDYKYEYRVQFLNISELDQEKIVQYIFDEQRKILRRQRVPSVE